jgi:hypothetical protein
MAKDWQRKLKRELQNEVLKEFENWTPAEFSNYILELREEIEALKAEMPADSKKGAEKAQKRPLSESLFKQEWSYPTKIHFLLELRHRPLTSEELAADLLRLDSHFKDYNSPQKNLSVHLNRSIKSGRIKRIKQPGIRALYFALPEWIDKEGNIQDRFSITQF